LVFFNNTTVGSHLIFIANHSLLSWCSGGLLE